ncbi:MAG: PEP-CTERM sorting domain-containing protein [Pirellulales bacterium]
MRSLRDILIERGVDVSAWKLGFPRGISGDGGTIVGEGIHSPIERGDVDRNVYVDIFDVAVLQTKYGMTSGATWADGDFDGNGTVDIFDVAAMQVNYGNGPHEEGWIATLGGGAPVTVPEPSTIVLAVLAALGMTVGWWRRRGSEDPLDSVVDRLPNRACTPPSGGDVGVIL